MLVQLDSENADRNIYATATCLTHTPSATAPMLCIGYIAIGDGVKNPDGTGGDFELQIFVGGQAVEPCPQTITAGANNRSAFLTAPFFVPANQEVIFFLTSPNAADTDVDVTAYLADMMPVADTSGNVVLTAAYDAAKTAAAQADVTTLLDRLTAARAGYMDWLNIGGLAASQADVQAITVSSRIRIAVPAQMERPDSGSTAYRIYIYSYNEQGQAEDLDSNPTITAENNAQTDRSANLSAVSKAAGTGIYYADYTVASDHAIEGLVYKVTATENAVSTVYSQAAWVTDVTAADFTAADRTKLEALYGKLPSAAYLLGGAAADGSGFATAAAQANTALEASVQSAISALAGKALETSVQSMLTRLTEARAGYIDKLNVSGTLAHSDAAATYKADVSALATAAVLTAVQKLLRADWKIELDGSDYQLVAYQEGTATELMRKDLNDVSGNSVQASATLVGQQIKAT